MTGTTAPACAVTSWVSWSRSVRRNGRTWMDGMTRPPGMPNERYGRPLPVRYEPIVATAGGRGAAMRLQILHVPGCPGADLLETRLAPLLAAHPGIELTQQVLASQADAERLGMTGSPT